MIGTTLSHFKILASLGKGGMGEVYRAEDTRLGREVAIKVLPEAMAGDPERLARFEREAKMLASLNHPNIAAIYSLESADRAGTEAGPYDDSTPAGTEAGPYNDSAPAGTGAGPYNDSDRAGTEAGPYNDSTPAGTEVGPCRFLVMELVEGEVLSTTIAGGPLAVEETLAITRQIAEALEAAHTNGIIHRDLKPGNVMVTTQGKVKVLDFGLARRHSAASELEEETPTATMNELTRENQIVGTIPYMSPEQIRSRPVGPASDIFSLGVLWFEMLTGSRPFQGETSVDLISSILRQPAPDLRALRPETPAAVESLIAECLAKEPEGRPSSASVLLQRLVQVQEALTATEAPASRSDSRSDAETAPTLDARAIAVLPFANLSGAEEAEFLATGLHNDLIAELSRVEGLTVISRSSVVRYRESEKTLPEIGRELSAGTIIEGTVQSVGNRVRLTAQLIDAVSDIQRWADRYDRELSTETLFELQSEVTRKIVDSLQSRLAPTLEAPPGRPQTHDMEAYRLVTLGRVQLERRTETGCCKALEHFSSAVERDPDYASAWAGLSEALAISVWYRYVEPGDLLERARRAARRAVGIDPESAEAHCSLATSLGAVRRGPEAIRELMLAVELQPSYWDAHNRLSYLNNLHGKAPSALAAAKRAVELNPLSAEAVSNLSLSLLTTGNAEHAIGEAQRAAELSPGWTTAPFYEAIPLYNLGRYGEAVALLEGVNVEWAGLGAEATLAISHLGAGHEASARQVLSKMDSELDAFAVGFVHLALGETDEAFEQFSQAHDLTDWACLAIHHLYREVWKAVQHDRRYDDLVRRAYESHDLEPPKGSSNV